MRTNRLALLSLPLVIALTATVSTAPAGDPVVGPVKIAMPASMFRDVKPVMFAALAQPFYSLVETQTGLKSELTLIQTPEEMRDQLESGKIQFGVFHGFEFAWIQQTSNSIQPLMVAAPQYKPLKGMVVVNENCQAKQLSDLRGKTIAMPQGSREYTRLFLGRRCRQMGHSPDAFFSQVTSPVNSDAALHEVVAAKAEAAVVDGGMWQSYTERYPGRAKKLKVLVASETFPESVVAYRAGKVDDDTLRRFRQGMSTAHNTPLGRNLMSLWSMAGFQPIPPNYQQQLADIMKSYPPPADAPK
jgi:ABC-type phosphate/phosphonate transport system substrate-binding protein